MADNIRNRDLSSAESEEMDSGMESSAHDENELSNNVELDDSDEDEESLSSESDEMDDANENANETPDVRRIYLPGQENSGVGELEYDESAYALYHQAKIGAPCLSFDVIPDNLGDDRGNQFPVTMYLVAGTQADRVHVNNIIVMKMSNMNKVKIKNKEDEKDKEEEEESESEDEDDKPELDSCLVHHPGCVNRIRVKFVGGRPIVASWSELGKVHLWDLTHPLRAVNDVHVMTNYVRNDEAPKPLFSFGGHQTEGFAMDWSPTVPGVLATGDCRKNIHIWKPQDGGTWHVDQRPYVAHTASVEDIQWSPNEASVLASCSVDKSIRIWDTRAPPNKACMLTTENAHDADVNVISWNHHEPFLLSGGDDAVIKVWDLREFKQGKPVALFKHHTAPITSVEWHPTDSTVFASAGADNQIAQWDLAVEFDPEAADCDKEDPALKELPPHLLFIHQGQTDIKELHWHSQIPGVLVSTAHSGFNIFRTISV